MLRDFKALIYPKVCMACSKALFKSELCICTRCLYHLPRTYFHLNGDNPVSRIFWGRVNLCGATSCYYFHKRSKVQQLIHRLKYGGQQEVGITIGMFYGEELKGAPPFSEAGAVIPVPLHPSKKWRRGYNQSEVFARGLSKSMGIPLYSHALVRAVKSPTQTKKSRYRRWKNVEGIFRVTRPDLLIDKHLLLVDDVITTGSTLEACAVALQNVHGVKISVATIACTV